MTAELLEKILASQLALHAMLIEQGQRLTALEAVRASGPRDGGRKVVGALQSDSVAEFFATRVVRAPGEFVAARQMYQAFQKWCEGNGGLTMTETRFGREASAYCVRDRSSRVRKYLDVRLSDDRLHDAAGG